MEHKGGQRSVHGFSVKFGLEIDHTGQKKQTAVEMGRRVGVLSAWRNGLAGPNASPW